MRLLLTFIVSVIIIWSGPAHAETVRLTSLEWPPYSGASLPGQGAAIVVARAAFEAKGHTLKVDFFPWSRTIVTAQGNGQYAGYLPEYWLESEEFVLSESLGLSPLGFAERTDNPIQWQSLDDLSDYLIGTVQDYVNTPELDARIQAGTVHVSEALTDSQNLLKLAAGRIDLAVIDRNVLQYLMRHGPYVTKVRDQLQWNSTLLAKNTLHVAFNDTPEGRRWLGILNEGLARIDADAILSEYLTRHTSDERETLPEVD